MNELEKKIAEALQNPQNLGELENADAVGTVGDSGCGEMLRMWLKFKEENGQKVIDRATFQSFGCDTAIAVASLATQMIRGKTVEEAMRLSGEELAADLGPLPPMKVHCSQLVESALRSALSGNKPAENALSSTTGEASGSLLDNFTRHDTGKRVVLLKSPEKGP